MTRFSPYTRHPWHGIAVHPASPQQVNAFIEIVPSDTVKYEIDKESGFLKVDRPQLFSNVIPALYGFIPQTFCGAEIASFCWNKTGTYGIQGDGDPLDICVLSEKEINAGYLLVQAIPIGGLRMIDNGEVDDKIIAVLKDDAVYGKWKDIADCPEALIDRLKHYFLTYKQMPGKEKRSVDITHVYNREEAHEVIQCSYRDYETLTSEN